MSKMVGKSSVIEMSLHLIKIGISEKEKGLWTLAINGEKDKTT